MIVDTEGMASPPVGRTDHDPGNRFRDLRGSSAVEVKAT